ncbi:MAG: hypothetical protein JSR48_08225, partial [Verrucomicrobia bacterium]|nr:hypothetical protein [Verrucomicrobiota bacterium]
RLDQHPRLALQRRQIDSRRSALALENFAGTGAVQGVRSLEATVQASQTL